MAAPAQAPVIVWFRRDLRLHDHPALAAAVRSGRPLLPVYVLASDGRPPGAASRWWLHHSLAALQADLSRRGSPLVLRAGPPADVLAGIAAATGAAQVAFNVAHDPDGLAQERRLRALLPGTVELLACPGDALHEPGTVLTGAGRTFQVFTPFWRACLARPEPAPPLPAPSGWPQPHAAVDGDRLEDWALRPRRPDWASAWPAHWRPGEAGALAALDGFLEAGLGDYARGRDRPDLPGTSRLSAHLHFGEVSPRQAWHAVRSRAAGSSRLAAGADAFLRELGWREFALHLLHAWPEMPRRPLQPDFARFPWRQDPGALTRWQRGLTGYPLVDAGMRQLWATGWMHNRVRMVTASFLVKHLLLDWREGEAWFWDTLVDADAANNAAGWQWVAGCGADAAPYFRVFNPVLQGRRFDPDGAYVRRWIPELARLPAQWLHAPWTAPRDALVAAGIVLGEHYPEPVVDHASARVRALAAYATLRSQASGP